MSYFNNLNPEVKEYFEVLSPRGIPEFILPYLETDTLQRLAGIDLFCGVSYTKMPLLSMKYFYSRLDHSVACALMIWNFTEEKEYTLAALFHDAGTPIFSHAVDFKMGDGINQESSEVSTQEMVLKDKQALELLKKDKVELSRISNLDNFPILDKPIPTLCVDRLEGIFATGLIWGQYLGVADIKNFYEYIGVAEEDPARWFMPASDRALNFGEELAINEEIANEFYEIIIKYSILLQTIEDKYAMKFLGEILRIYEVEGVLTPTDFYSISEAEAISKMISSNHRNLWHDFSSLRSVGIADPQDFSFKVAAKLRYCDPMISTPYGFDVLGFISSEADDATLKLITFYRQHHNLCVKGPISKESVRQLSL